MTQQCNKVTTYIRVVAAIDQVWMGATFGSSRFPVKRSFVTLILLVRKRKHFVSVWRAVTPIMMSLSP